MARGHVAGGRLSGLTIRGRCLLAAGLATAVCGAVLDERDLLRAGAFVALLPLLSVLLAARNRRTVRVERDISPLRVGAGGEVTVRLELSGGPLIGALRLADTVPDGAGPSPAAPPRFTVHRLPAKEGVVLSYPLVPVQRGVHRVGPLTGRATDPLGLAEFDTELAEPSKLLVRPRVTALRGTPRSLGAGDDSSGSSLAHQGQGRSDVLVRGYRPGDEIRRVHWRSTARHDELMVRLEERPRRIGTTVLLDRRDEAHRGHGPDSSLEFAISLVASVGTHLVRTGDPLSVVTEDGVEIGSGTTGTDALLDALAGLRPAARSELGGPNLAGGTDLLAVLGDVGPGKAEPLITGRSGGGYAVLLDTMSWDPSGGRRAGSGGSVHETAAMLGTAGWQVVIAGAGDSVEHLWDQLVAGVSR